MSGGDVLLDGNDGVAVEESVCHRITSLIPEISVGRIAKPFSNSQGKREKERKRRGEEREREYLHCDVCIWDAIMSVISS